MVAFSPLESANDGFKRKITLTFYDTLVDEVITIENRPVPLEADYSTPLGILLSKIREPDIGLGGMLNPGRYAGRVGISMLEPYREDKIPVVMVHGLLSWPVTWMQMFNDLRGDPDIRKNYQFWFFFYPTGLPIMYSASLLRQDLLEMQATFDPGGTHPAFEEMVVICHSLGGLLSRLMVQDSGTAYYDSVFKVPFEELAIAAEEKETIRKIVFFDTMPSIKRVVFIATPHRGSPLADSFIARLGSGFVSLPSDVTDLGDAIAADKEQQVCEEL